MVFDLGLIVTFSLSVWVAIDLLLAGGARDRRLPFVALASTSGIWMLGELVGRRATTPDDVLFAWRILHLGVSMLPVAWLVTAATVARARWMRRAPWLVLIPFASASFTYSSLYWDDQGLFLSGPYATPEHGPVFWYSAVVGWILIVIGSVHFLVAARRFDRARPLRIVAVALGSTVPLIGNMLYLAGMVGLLDPTPLLIGAAGVTLRFAIIDTGLSAMLHQASDGVLERLKTGILLADLEGRVVDSNPMARSLSDDPDPRGATLEDLVARTLAKPERVIDVERIKLHRPLGDLGHAVLLTDRTEAVALEDRLREAQRRESLELLAAGVAHDFNNVLTVIRGCAERASSQLDEDHRARSTLAQLSEATRGAGRLVEQLLAYAGQHGGAPRLLDLKSELEGLKMLATVAAGPRAHVEFDLARDLPAVEANPVEIQQLVVNLVANAAQASDAQATIRVRAAAERLTVADLESARPGHDAGPGDYVLIEVSDHGRGMDAATLERIFDPFFTTRAQGHGLGLAVLLGIVHSYGGALHVASTPGAGTTFGIHLPAARAAAPPGDLRASSGSGAARPPTATAEPGRHRTVLVVEDDAGVRELMTYELEALGCLPVLAATAAEAEEQLDQHRGRIDVALVDLELPDRSFPVLFRALRTAQPGLRIVVMTGHEQAHAQERLADEVVDAVLRKPFEPGMLAHALQVAELPGSEPS